MKKNLILLGTMLGLGLATYCVAQSFAPKYVTQAAYGNATTGATMEFAAQPGAQFRLVSVYWGSDTNNANLSIETATTLYNVTFTNYATTATTNCINATNGLSGSATLLLEHGGSFYTATVSSWGASTNASLYTGYTNVVLGSGGFGVATSVGDPVYLMTSAQVIPLGVGTNWVNSEAIYIGNPGRPVWLQLGPALVTNKLYSVVGKYE